MDHNRFIRDRVIVLASAPACPRQFQLAWSRVHVQAQRVLMLSGFTCTRDAARTLTELSATPAHLDAIALELQSSPPPHFRSTIDMTQVLRDLVAVAES
eukprot:2352477-Amphidinium_carterae.2